MKFHEFLFNLAFEYETPKIVTIRNVKVGVVYRTLQLAVIAYVIGYTILYMKGYQNRERGQSTVLTKVKGVSSSYSNFDLPPNYRRIWDPADYTVPSMLPNSLFIVTNMVITAHQKMATCPEDPTSNNRLFVCDPDNLENQCPAGTVHDRGQLTGRCVPINSKLANFTCEILSWCPLEDDSITKRMRVPVINNAANFTVFYKNYVEFPNFQVKRRNVDCVNDSYAIECRYHPTNHPLCPIFRLGDIADYIGLSFDNLALKGSVINVIIKWDCNLDFKVENCIPVITFSTLDELSSSSFSPGFNFRYAHHYRDMLTGELHRDLIKAYGILFVFNIEAEARQFSIVQLTLNIGAGLALLGLVSIFVDIFLFNFGKERRYYHEKKYVTVSQDELKQFKAKSKMSNATNSYLVGLDQSLNNNRVD